MKNRPVTDIPVNARVDNVLKCNGIKTTDEAADFINSGQWFRTINFGRASLNRLAEKLRELGYTISPKQLPRAKKDGTPPRELGTSVYLLKSDIEDLIHVFENEDLFPHLIDKLRTALPKVR